jgi:hypothetical protein
MYMMGLKKRKFDVYGFSSTNTSESRKLDVYGFSSTFYSEGPELLECMTGDDTSAPSFSM